MDFVPLFSLLWYVGRDRCRTVSPYLFITDFLMLREAELVVLGRSLDELVESILEHIVLQAVSIALSWEGC